MRLAHAQAHHGAVDAGGALSRVFLASKGITPALLFGQLIIMVVYLPIFALTGVEGRCSTRWRSRWWLRSWEPMILSVTFIPAAVALFIGHRVSGRKTSWLNCRPSAGMARCWIA